MVTETVVCRQPYPAGVGTTSAARTATRRHCLSRSPPGIGGGAASGRSRFDGRVGLILVSGLVGWPVGALVRRLRGRPAPEVAGLQRAARWAAALAGLLAIGFEVGLVLAIRDAAAANPLLLAFGVSGDFGWVFHLPWVVLALTAGAVLAAIRSWRHGWWSVLHRVHYGLVAAGCIVFLGAVAYLGLV